MKKIALFVMLIVALSACTPVLPSRNQTIIETPVVEENVSSEPVAEENVTETVPEPQVTPTVETDLRDVPRKEVTEGDLVIFPNLKAVDPDGDPIHYTFTEPLSEKGEWSTKEGDAGDHLITITASDGSNTVEQKVLLVVLPKNKPPMISLEEPIEAVEGTTFTLSPNVTDPDSDPVSITFDAFLNEIFLGEVSFIEPGDVVIDGIVNYKVRVSLKNFDPRIKSGLTANLKIETSKKENVVSIPMYVVIKEGDKNFVNNRYEESIADNFVYPTK